MYVYVTKGWGGGGLNATLKKNIGSRIMRFQTNIRYANSQKWDGICFLEKNMDFFVLCHIKLMGGGVGGGGGGRNSIQNGILVCYFVKFETVFGYRNSNY